MSNIAGALYRVIKIKKRKTKRNEVQPENEVSVTVTFRDLTLLDIANLCLAVFIMNFLFV